MGTLNSKFSCLSRDKGSKGKEEDGKDSATVMADRILEIMAEACEKEPSSDILIPWLLHAIEIDQQDDETLFEEKATRVQAVQDKHRARPPGVVYPDHVKVCTIDEVKSQVTTARNNKTTLRVAGSEHSTAQAIFPGTEGGVTILLSGKLREVELLDEVTEEGQKVAYVRIGGGCYLGHNPLDEESTKENSAIYQINEYGYSFPDLGGIIHQSIGGFMMTGSAGGSLKHSFGDVIAAIEFVNGKGELMVANPGSDLWCAMGVSMGLFGIITRVTFRLPERFYVEGIEISMEFSTSSLGPGDDGKSRIESALKDTEYFRVNWFPEKYLNRAMEWKGHQTTKQGDDPYKSPLDDLCIAIFAALALKICNCIQQKENPTDIDYRIMALLLKPFVPLNKPQSFCDLWYKILPMDNDARVDGLIKVDFTEIWVPIDKSQQVMEKLNEMFKNNPKSAGSFAVEIYGSKKSPFWMSMSYDYDFIRVDVYWWHYNKGDLREYFTYYWDALLGIEGTRLHWGKYLPRPGQKCGEVVFNKEWVKEAYPKYEAWEALRAKADPDQVFVSPYWRDILGIPDVPKTEE